MRIPTTILTVLAGSSALLSGCAHCQPCTPCQTINVAPSPDELLRHKPCESTICASVAVEGGKKCCPGPCPVPEFKEPELTPEEKEALCIKPEVFNFLEFYLPKPCVPVSQGCGGPTVAAWGMAGDVSCVGIPRRGMAAGPPLQPVSCGSLPAVRVAEAGNARPPISGVGLGQGGASVCEGGVSKVAAHSERCDP
jgi:hypothetical protein